MHAVSLSSKGQIVIPKFFRDLHGLKTGMRLAVAAFGTELRLHPIVETPTLAPAQVKAGFLHRPNTQPMSNAEIERRIANALGEDDRASKTSKA